MAEKRKTLTQTHAAAPAAEIKVDPRDVEARELEAAVKSVPATESARFKGVGVWCPTIDGKAVNVTFDAKGCYTTSDAKVIEWCRTKFTEITPSEDK